MRQHLENKCSSNVVADFDNTQHRLVCMQCCDCEAATAETQQGMLR